MDDKLRVIIGIQARSTSSRFPGKVFEMLGDKPILQHMIDNAKEACVYLNKFKERNTFTVLAGLCVPWGDPIKDKFKDKISVIVEGPEDDVLARYKILMDKMYGDYVVRITADCPMIPSYVITKHINTAVKNHYDYASNVDERIRTSLDGLDCEVISRRLLDYAHEHAKDRADREHVTTFVRREPPSWARVAHLIGYFDFAQVKLSVDTPEDLERVRAHYDRIKLAIERAEELHGNRVHRL
jgi:spore coat polysaccharide biosynthesis protein SpsF